MLHMVGKTGPDRVLQMPVITPGIGDTNNGRQWQTAAGHSRLLLLELSRLLDPLTADVHLKLKAAAADAFAQLMLCPGSSRLYLSMLQDLDCPYLEAAVDLLSTCEEDATSAVEAELQGALGFLDMHVENAADISSKQRRLLVLHMQAQAVAAGARMLHAALRMEAPDGGLVTGCIAAQPRAVQLLVSVAVRRRPAYAAELKATGSKASSMLHTKNPFLLSVHTHHLKEAAYSAAYALLCLSTNEPGKRALQAYEQDLCCEVLSGCENIAVLSKVLRCIQVR
eukprot:jgi/Chrzof1/4677/Cz14g22140.t1